ncbi:hypothetical protein N7E02_26360 [Aliirhizobium terrae]|uniref:hypothetical protein n=1 Tax=Terrirhizobium terrae TaxID=2926709 RepID=UPI002576C941|nr:hypothetical protein [Rhizobium sp. CC-CFT758]WJH42383.1 hypothetical protein N7E02_26360 [Rhizobium sp. CC-CFT758]
MFEDLIGAYGGRLVVAVLGVGAALLCLIGILWIVRGRRGPRPSCAAAATAIPAFRCWMPPRSIPAAASSWFAAMMSST